MNQLEYYAYLAYIHRCKEYHVHATDLINDIKEADKVEIELKEIDRGFQVVNVRALL